MTQRLKREKKGFDCVYPIVQISIIGESVYHGLISTLVGATIVVGPSSQATHGSSSTRTGALANLSFITFVTSSTLAHVSMVCIRVASGVCTLLAMIVST